MNYTTAQDSPKTQVRWQGTDCNLFLAVLGHELKAPLDVIATCAEEALCRRWNEDTAALLMELAASVQEMAHALAERTEPFTVEGVVGGSFPEPLEVAELCVARVAAAITAARARTKTAQD